MIKILFCGICGRMGRNTIDTIASSDSMKEKFEIIAGVDLKQTSEFAFPVYGKISEVKCPVDVIIDFSHNSQTVEILEYAKARMIPAIICTTGHSEEQKEFIKDAARHVPVFLSGNMSLGINLLSYLTKKAASVLGEEFDIEIVEAHHNKKLDAPSGTAIMLADSASEGLQYSPDYVYDRHSVRAERQKEEIGIHSIRGGNIVGEHSVIFAGSCEIVTLSHSASSRAVFASGALRAAEFIVERDAGLYNMNDVFADLF